MAIYLPKTTNIVSTEAKVAAGYIVDRDGQALVRAAANQAAGVLPATGTSGEVFVGFSLASTVGMAYTEGFANKVERLLVPVTGQVTLERTPVSGQVAVFDETAGAAVATPTVSGANITGLEAGNTVVVTYKYALTVNESKFKYGDQQPGGYVGLRVGQIGLIKSGQVFTSEFNASKNWAAATSIKLAANGQLTDQSGSGTTINGYVIAVPSADYPFLGIEFTAA